MTINSTESYKFATKDLSITTAEAFVRSVKMSNDPTYNTSDGDGRSEKNSIVLYVCLGNSESWEDEPNPEQVVPNEQYLNFELHRKMIGGKKVLPNGISHVIKRVDWIHNKVYQNQLPFPCKLFQILHKPMRS